MTYPHWAGMISTRGAGLLGRICSQHVDQQLPETLDRRDEPARPGEWAPRMVGPKETMSQSGRRS